MIVDITQPETWPLDLARLATANNEPDIDDDAAEHAFAGTTLRLFHASRLTTSEVADVNANGILPWSYDLIERKLSFAVADGYLTAAEAATVLETRKAKARYGHWRSNDDNRAGYAVLFAGLTSVMRGRVSSKFKEWGGELDVFLADKVAFGKPVLIEVEVPIDALGTFAAYHLAYAAWQHVGEHQRIELTINTADGHGVEAGEIIAIHDHTSDFYKAMTVGRNY